MMSLALYAASAALYAASPSTPSTVEQDALAAPMAEQPAASADPRAEGDAPRVQARRGPARSASDAAMRSEAEALPAPDPGFKESDDARRFQQETWTGP